MLLKQASGRSLGEEGSLEGGRWARRRESECIILQMGLESGDLTLGTEKRPGDLWEATWNQDKPTKEMKLS